jgi:SAM-dependent methyltransferase
LDSIMEAQFYTLAGMDTDKSGAPVHPEAQLGFSRSAAAYSRGRPDYPAQLRTGCAGAATGPGRHAIDLGAGTGKFTRLLLQTAAHRGGGRAGRAMRAQLQQQLPGVTALAASAQALPLADASVDALVCAQAFHWFASAQALQEIGRVLDPAASSGWSGMCATRSLRVGGRDHAHHGALRGRYAALSQRRVAPAVSEPAVLRPAGERLRATSTWAVRRR